MPQYKMRNDFLVFSKLLSNKVMLILEIGGLPNGQKPMQIHTQNGNV